MSKEKIYKAGTNEVISDDNGERELQLSTGRTVAHKDVTFQERMDAGNAVQTGIIGGEVVMYNTRQSQTLWVKYGLAGIADGVWQANDENGRIYATDKTLDRLSNTEMSEIGTDVRIRAQAGDYGNKEDKGAKVDGE